MSAFRDDLCVALQQQGVEAHLAELGQPEEGIGVDWLGKSQGLIEIRDSPIRWVNVREEIRTAATDAGPGTASVVSTSYYVECGVPDPQVTPSYDKLRIRTVRVKRFPLFGRVSDLRWEGDDLGLGLLNQLNGDISIKGSVLQSQDLRIRAYSEHKCWLISTTEGTALLPSAELWNCYQAIAQHVLVSVLPTSVAGQ